MENLLQDDEELLKSELYNYTIQKVLIDGKDINIIVRSKDSNVTLRFEDVQKIDMKGDMYGIVGVILYTGVKKIGNTTVKTTIISSIGVNISIISKKLTITKL